MDFGLLLWRWDHSPGYQLYCLTITLFDNILLERGGLPHILQIRQSQAPVLVCEPLYSHPDQMAFCL